MLTFIRKKGESFYIGKDVEVTISEIENHQVRISVNAPRNIPILRKELVDHSSSPQNREDMAELIQSIKQNESYYK